MFPTHKYWRPETPLSKELMKSLHVKHTKREKWEKFINPGYNPLDYTPCVRLFVKHLYSYAKEHEMDSDSKLRIALSHVKAALNHDCNYEITGKHVWDKYFDLRREFFNFRQFLEFPGIRLSDDKKRAIAGPAYFKQVPRDEECWLFRRFRLVGIDFYKEMRYIIMQKQAGGAGPDAGEQACYFIYDRNSDIGEEIIDVWDYDMDSL